MIDPTGCLRWVIGICVLATWSLDCDSKGPRGVAVDADNGLVFVACTDHMAVLDGARDGAQVARFDTGGGVDNIDWMGPKRLLYAAAGAAAKVTVARIDAKGQPTIDLLKDAYADGLSFDFACGDEVYGSANSVVRAMSSVYIRCVSGLGHIYTRLTCGYLSPYTLT